MSADNPPDAATTAPSPPDAAVIPLLTEAGKASPATLTLHSAHLALADTPGAQPYVILREEMMRTVLFMEAIRALSVRSPRKMMFRLKPEGAKALADWIGKPTLAYFYLKRRFAWVGPVAILWLAASLVSLLPTAEGRVGQKFDVLFFSLGAVLLVAWLVSKWRPHPALFLVDSLWFAMLAVYWTIRVIQGENRYWLLLVVVGIWMSITGMRHFLRFKDTRLDAYWI